MYGWIWRQLPGPVGLRVLLATLMIGAVVAVLFLWGFDYLAPYMPFNGGTVTE